MCLNSNCNSKWICDSRRCVFPQLQNGRNANSRSERDFAGRGAGRIPGPARSQWLWQIHAAQSNCRTRPPILRNAFLRIGRDLAAMSSEELASHRNHTIGIVFQSFQLLPRMTLGRKRGAAAAPGRGAARRAPCARARSAGTRRPGGANEASAHLNFPAANSNAGPLPAPSSISP